MDNINVSSIQLSTSKSLFPFSSLIFPACTTFSSQHTCAHTQNSLSVHPRSEPLLLSALLSEVPHPPVGEPESHPSVLKWSRLGSHKQPDWILPLEFLWASFSIFPACGSLVTIQIRCPDSNSYFWTHHFFRKLIISSHSVFSLSPSCPVSPDRSLSPQTNKECSLYQGHWELCVSGSLTSLNVSSEKWVEPNYF